MAAMRRGGRKGEPAQGRESGGEARKGRVGSPKAGGGAGVAATASGGEARLGQAASVTWRGQGWPARCWGRRRWSREGHVDGAERRCGGGCGAHGRPVRRQRCAPRNRGEGERGRRRRTQMQIAENAGTPL
jgi:hypothetical protein